MDVRAAPPPGSSYAVPLPGNLHCGPIRWLHQSRQGIQTCPYYLSHRPRPITVNSNRYGGMKSQALQNGSVAGRNPRPRRWPATLLPKASPQVRGVTSRHAIRSLLAWVTNLSSTQSSDCDQPSPATERMPSSAIRSMSMRSPVASFSASTFGRPEGFAMAPDISSSDAPRAV